MWPKSFGREGGKVVVRAYLRRGAEGRRVIPPSIKTASLASSPGALLTAKWSPQYLQTSPGRFRQQYTLSSSLGFESQSPGHSPLLFFTRPFV